nr:MAG TPA: hypothetical protein [Bacteriophage sp.]
MQKKFFRLRGKFLGDFYTPPISRFLIQKSVTGSVKKW